MKSKIIQKNKTVIIILMLLLPVVFQVKAQNLVGKRSIGIIPPQQTKIWVIKEALV